MQNDSNDIASAGGGHSLKKTKVKSRGKAISLFPTMKDLIHKKLAYDSLPELEKSSSINEDLLPGALTQYRGMSMGRVRFIKSLWHTIDNSIVESAYLSEYGHVGQVVLTFEVTPDGQLYGNRIHARAENSILKVVAARAVRKAIKNETKELVFPNEKIKVEAQFLWARYSKCAQHRGTYQNVLSFCKYGEDNRKSFTVSEKTATYLGALKYGPGVFEEIQKYRKEEDHRKTKFDPFEEFRRDPDYNLGS